MRIVVGTLLLASGLLLTGCSGTTRSASGGTNNTPASPAPAVSNVLPISVNSGPAAPGNPYLNGIFASVTVCGPGSSSCQTINDVLVDTGSEGLRVLSSVLTAPLPNETINGNNLVECVQYADGSFNWGTVRRADIKLAGEEASSVPIQVIGDMAAATIPANCSKNAMTGNAGKETDTLQALGANGILGVGPFRQDCGPNCPSSTANLPANSYLPYYVCPSGGTCQPTGVTVSQQLQNPVWMLSKDNNGMVIQLPAISATGAPSVSGSLIFGIGTQSNNGLNGAKVITLDGSGNFSTTFNNNTYNKSFIDSGSNAYFFPNTTSIAACTNTSQFGSGIKNFYCPASTLNLTAVNQGRNGTQSSVSFNVANAETLFSGNSGGNFAFDDIGGTNPPPSFDWGLPFFYERSVFTAIEGQSTPGGTGPYFAY